MNIICWNCKGTGSKLFPTRVKDLIRNKEIDILVLLETRTSGKKADGIVSRLGYDSWIRVEATGFAGGIWLLWNEDTHIVQYLQSDVQHLHCKVTERGNGTTVLFTCIYADPNPYNREPIWAKIIALSRDIKIPWMVVGDFNTYLSIEDKIGSKKHNWRSIGLFNKCIQEVCLIQMEHVGEKYTWEKGKIKERIDWAFCNLEWSETFAATRLFHLIKFGSDHRLLWIRSKTVTNRNKKGNIFRCSAAWFLEKSFGEVVDKSWKGRNWVDECQKFMQNVQQWNKDKVGYIPAKKNRILKRIEAMEANPMRGVHPKVIEQERDLWGEYNKLIAQEELIWYQKSRCNWLRWGR